MAKVVSSKPKCGSRNDILAARKVRYLLRVNYDLNLSTMPSYHLYKAIYLVVSTKLIISPLNFYRIFIFNLHILILCFTFQGDQVELKAVLQIWL